MKNFLREGLAKKVILFAFIIGLVSPSAMAYRDGGYPAGTSPIDQGVRPSSEASLVAAVAPSVQNLNVSSSNGSATVTFSLNTNANTTVWIKDTTDTIVKTLVFDNYLAPGVTHSYIWNGTNNDGQTVSSGSYKAQVVAYNTVSSDIENYSFQYTAGQSQVAPVVTVSTNPSSFDPSKGESTTVTYTLNTSASLRVEVKYNGSIIKTLRSQSEQGAGSYNLVWDGRNTNGTVMGPNNYTVEVYAVNNAGSTTKTANAVIVNNPVEQAPVVTVSASPLSFDPTDGETTSVNYSLNTTANLRVDIKQGSSVVKTLRSLASQNAGSYSLVWDGRNTSGTVMGLGTYTAEVYAVNNSGSDTDTASVTIVENGGGVTAPNLTNVYANPTPFDPDTENTRIYFTLDKTASTTVTIRDGSSTIRTLVSGTQLSAGTYYYEWNGRNSSGNVVGDGTYTARVNASNSAGADTEDTSVQVDSNGNGGTCDIVTTHYVDPSTFDPKEEDAEITYSLSRSANVTIKIKEYSGGATIKTLFTNQYRSSGTHNVFWNGRESDGDYASDRSYSYEITAEVSGCSNDVEYGTVRVDSDGSNNDNDWPSTDESLIRNLIVRNEIFDPRYGERSEVEFELTDRADLVVQVMDGNRVIRTLRDSDNQASGDYSNYWDGRDDDGDRVRDDVYQFRVMADNGDDTDTDRAYVEVDTDGYIIGFPESDRCAGYRDVSVNSPFCKAIELMTERGIFEGYSDGTFRPYASINRAETVKVVTLALGYDVNIGGTYRTGYRDTSDTAWYAPYLYVAKREGIATGYPDGSFRPSSTINRVELLRVFLEGNKTNLYSCSPQPFTDTPITSDTNWYMKYACYAKDHGLMNSEYSNMLYPAEAMTRGDVADLFYDFEIKGLYSSYVLSRTGRSSSNFGERVCVQYDRYGDCIRYEYADNGYYDDYNDGRYCVDYDIYGDCERYAYDYNSNDGYYIYRDGEYIWITY